MPIAKRESKTSRKQRTLLILERMREMYPRSECSLVHRDAFQLLVATVMSAQTTDAMVNRITPALFARYPTPDALARADVEELENIIRPVNYYRTKARALIGIADALVARFGGVVPRSMEELTSLPGVGRKTANVALGVGFGIAEGIVVDTHVKRITHRLGLTKQSDAVRIEEDLLPLVPYEERVVFTHRMIDHGRAICQARTPLCSACGLLELCPTGLTLISQPPKAKRRPASPRKPRRSGEGR